MPTVGTLAAALGYNTYDTYDTHPKIDRRKGREAPRQVLAAEPGPVGFTA